MKTDLVLTMEGYLAMSSDIPKRVDPPTSGAHHIPITAESGSRANTKARACRCDRWGHPCAGCIEQNHGHRAPIQDFGNKEER